MNSVQPTRRPILAANWKMQKTVAEAVAFARDFLPLVEDADAVGILRREDDLAPGGGGAGELPVEA